MKINKWTLGLAALGLVSLSSVVNAEEKTSSSVMTALSSTTISGYVDASAQWNPGTGSVTPPYSFAAGKQDGFNLNLVQLKLEKPLAEGEWSAGYVLDTLFGPDTAVVTNPNLAGFASDNGVSEHVRQAYVALRAPVGNGLDLKLGRFDSIVGYESTDSYKNPNFTRSYGYTLQPTEHTGVLATYQFSDLLTLNAGIANTLTTSAINDRSSRAESHKTYMASAAITAPESTGFLAGSALYLGVISGDAVGGTENQESFYVGGTLATPVEGLRIGASFDYLNNPIVSGGNSANEAYAVALYASFKATEKMGFHTRAEYAKAGSVLGEGKIFALTGTLQYDLWENVLSRLEVRWDHKADGTDFSTPTSTGNTKKNEVALIANLVYKF